MRLAGAETLRISQSGNTSPFNLHILRDWLPVPIWSQLHDYTTERRVLRASSDQIGLGQGRALKAISFLVAAKQNRRGLVAVGTADTCRPEQQLAVLLIG